MRPIPLDCGGWLSGFSIHSSGRIYAYGDVFGMWRSDNAGRSWQYLLHDFTTYDHFVNGSAVSTVDANTVVFVGERALFKSTDGGKTWNRQLDRINQSRTRGATPVIFQPGSSTELWLAAARNRETGYLWRSVDGGATWTKMGGDTFDKVRATTIYVRPEFPDQIWVGAVGGMYVSTDHGATFTSIWDNGGGRNPMGYRPEVSAIARRSDGIGYFASNIAGYRVTATDFNDPKTFTVTPVVTRVHGAGPVSATALVDNSFVTSDLTGSYCRRSPDGSPGTWTDLPMKLSPEFTPVYMAPVQDAKAPGGRDMIVQDPRKPSRWFMTGGKAPVITEDNGANWTYPPNGSGLAGVVVYGKIGFPRDNPKKALIPAADQGVFVVNDGGASGKADYCSRRTYNKHAIFQQTMFSHDGQTIVVAGCEQSSNRNLIYKSVNGGKDWQELDLANSGLPPSDEGIQRAVNAPGSTTDFLVLLGYRGDRKNNNPGLYRTTDGGVRFSKVTGIPDGVDTGHRYDPSPSHLETDGVRLETRYLALRSGNNAKARGFYRSTDGGSSWAKTAVQPFGDGWITAMAVDASIGGRVWLCGGGKGLSRTDDAGDTWTPVGDFTQAAQVSAVKSCVAVWGRRRGDQWNKLYYSTDDGAVWTEVTGPGRRFGSFLNVTINPHKTHELWISGISVNVLTVSPTARTATNLPVKNP